MGTNSISSHMVIAVREMTCVSTSVHFVSINENKNTFFVILNFRVEFMT